MITEMKNVLECLDSVGIQSAIIEPNDDGGVQIRASDQSRTIIVFDQVDVEKFADKPLGILSVRALLTRLRLFDNDAKIEFDEDSSYVKNITIKKGRKKASYRCASPDTLGVPMQALEGLQIDKDNAITFTKSYVTQLNHVFQSIGLTGSKENQMVTIGVKDHTAEIIIFDGEDDSFKDAIEDVSAETCEKSSWDIQSFQRVLKQSIEGNEETTFGVSSYGTATFNIGMIDVIVCPFN